MQRRRFLAFSIAGIGTVAIGCASRGDDDGGGDDGGDDGDPLPGDPDAATAPTADADPGPPGVDAAIVMFHDTYAQALYLDGSYGPLTGTITAQAMQAKQEYTLDFWHGHGGQPHRFTITTAHIDQLLCGQRVYIQTTTVDAHEHMLFIDPLDPEYAVPGGDVRAVERGACF
jgi:hypothetical protein